LIHKIANEAKTFDKRPLKLSAALKLHLILSEINCDKICFRGVRYFITEQYETTYQKSFVHSGIESTLTMKKHKKRAMKKYILLIFTLLALSVLSAQTETLPSGSFIINMGATNPNTVANGLKPYGLVYDLIRNHSVPIKWVIGAGKVKDGVDFTYNGVQYKGGTFIIPAQYRTAAVNAKITSWQGLGVVGTTTTSALTVNVTQTLTAAPRWTLDATNGAIAEKYMVNAGITNTAFPGAYNWLSPQALDVCDDLFVMPHADPEWATHSNLFSWNQNSLGSIWAACHAVSALENCINPGNTTQQMNFLSTRTTAVTHTSILTTPWHNTWALPMVVLKLTVLRTVICQNKMLRLTIPAGDPVQKLFHTTLPILVCLHPT
jgi:hypothetical protein